MRVIKVLRVAFFCCLAVIGVSANAQTPVSCNWATISSEGPPNGSSRYISQQCNESNGTFVAGRSFVWVQGSITSCNLSTATNVTYTGDCMSPSFFRTSIPSTPACANAGKYLGNVCGNSASNIPVHLACGSNCSLRFETVGWTAMCPHPGQSPAGSPELKVFCK